MSALILTSAVARPVLRLEPATANPSETCARPAKPLNVGGVTPFSATDYPGKLAAVVFVQGCPWRCGYCHNPHLQTRAGQTQLHWSQVITLLKRRVGLIDAVVFSGGEPTIDPALEDAVREVRALGFSVGLHSAGTYPRRLVEVLPLLDWVGLDIKASWSAYDHITGIADSGRHALASAEAVLASGVSCEFRTTVHPALHSEQEILALAQTLSAMGVRHYALQVFRSTGCANGSLQSAATAGYPSADLVRRISVLFERFTFRRE